MIVDKPKRGDIMCITKDQKVIWIDGLSIEPTQLFREFEPVGICLVVKGNKALVRYKEERDFKWAASERWELPNSSIMSDGNEHSLKITLNDVENPNPFRFTSTSRKEFVNQLNTWFSDNDTDYSAELVELDTDLPATDTSDNKDGDNYRNRIIVNARFTNSWKTINIEGIGAGTCAIAKDFKAVNFFYRNNRFTANYPICCKAKTYDSIQISQKAPTSAMTSINKVPGGVWEGQCPVRLVDFTNDVNCKLLRDTFTSYDEYLDSMMTKLPCGAGGAIAEFPCGKENTYNLANCTFLDNAKGEQEVLYPAANWAASIDLNAPKLGKGNWWLPSVAEMCEIMQDITYRTSFWETNPDIINSVLAKLTSSGWSMLSASTTRWTSSKYATNSPYYYSGTPGFLGSHNFYIVYTVSPITIYEF